MVMQSQNPPNTATPNSRNALHEALRRQSNANVDPMQSFEDGGEVKPEPSPPEQSSGSPQVAPPATPAPPQAQAPQAPQAPPMEDFRAGAPTNLFGQMPQGQSMQMAMANMPPAQQAQMRQALIAAVMAKLRMPGMTGNPQAAIQPARSPAAAPSPMNPQTPSTGVMSDPSIAGYR